MASFLIEIIGLRPDVVVALRDTPVAEDATKIVEATMEREATALSGVDLTALATAVPQPALLLLGDASPPWAPAVTASLACALPSASVVVLRGQGHEAVDTAPEKVAAELNAFLTLNCRATGTTVDSLPSPLARWLGELPRQPATKE